MLPLFEFSDDRCVDHRRRKVLGTIAGSVAVAAAAWPGFVVADAIDGDVVFLRPKDKGYDYHTTLFNQCIKRRPAIVAVCYNENGVVQAVRRARREKLPVAIKSGGHSFEGFSINDGGFVIDVSEMQEQQLHKSGLYTVGPACSLMLAYEELVPEGRMLSLGSCGMVGISGLTLGGGYGLFSRQHGLACDALRSLRMVDGNGDLHQVKKGSGPGSELFRACCGGGNGNFGVITQLAFETFEAPKHLWRYLFKCYKLDAGRAEACAKLWFKLAPTLPHSVFSAFVLNHRTLTILLTNTAEESSPELLSALGRLEQMADKRYPDKKEPLIDGIRRYYGRLDPLYFKNASAGYYSDYNDIAGIAPDLFQQITTTPGMLYQINTVGGAIGDMDDGTHTAYAHRKANFISEVQSYWEKPERAAHYHAAVGAFLRKLDTHGLRNHYCNYPDLSFSDWPLSYYGKAGYQRLQRVKKQYDPDNLFQHAQSIRL